MIGENETVKFLLVKKDLQRSSFLINNTASNKVNIPPEPGLEWKIATPPPNNEYYQLEQRFLL